MLTLPGSLPLRCMLKGGWEDFGLLLGTSRRLEKFLASLWLLPIPAEETPDITFPLAPLVYMRRPLPWPNWALAESRHKASSSAALSTLLRRYFPKVQFLLVVRLSWRSRKALWVSVLVRRSSVSLERGTSLFGICGLLYAEHVPSVRSVAAGLLCKYTAVFCCSRWFFNAAPLSSSEGAEETEDEE